jgi:DNA-binding transcriptional ArsR family regulator
MARFRFKGRTIYCQKKVLARHYTLRCNERMERLTDVLTAISHPTRRAIIGRLANGPARFTEVAKPFDTALNSVTKHLKLLERAGLIEREKRGREVFISFRGEPLREVAGWVNEYERFWNERLDLFQKHFKDKREKNSKTHKKTKNNHHTQRRRKNEKSEDH